MEGPPLHQKKTFVDSATKDEKVLIEKKNFDEAFTSNLSRGTVRKKKMVGGPQEKVGVFFLKEKKSIRKKKRRWPNVGSLGGQDQGRTGKRSSLDRNKTIPSEKKKKKTGGENPLRARVGWKEESLEKAPKGLGDFNTSGGGPRSALCGPVFFWVQEK